MEFDFVVAPGADPKTIRFAIETGNWKPETGNSKLENGSPKLAAGESKIQNLKPKIAVAANGDLVIATEAGEVRFRKPVVYQEQLTVDSRQLTAATDHGPRTTDPVNHQSSIGNRQFLDGHYILTANNQVHFEVPSYDKSRPLIIDPVLSYSTFLGGSWDEQPTSAIIVDSSGSVYVTGLTWSPDFPTSPGALDPSCGADGTCDSGFLDVFVTKLNAQGSDILYSTYLGGSGDDNAWGFAVSSSGNAYIVGNTSSADFPTTAGAFDATCGTDGACNGTDDGFVTVLNAAGTALVYSTYFGGSSDEFAEGVAVDGAGNAYVTGATWSSDYPTTSATAFQPTLAGDNDGFFAKLDPDVSGSGSLLYSTYLGGSYGDHAWRVVVDSAGNAYISGWTYSFNFPTTPGVFQPTHADTTINADAFAAKLDPALAGAASLVYSTFLGGAATDRPEALALDASGNAYLAGWTTSSDFPTTPYSFDTACGTDGTCNGGLEDAFVAKLNPTATALEYSTYLGATGDDYARGLAVDSSGNAYVTGGTNSTDFPAINAIQVLNAGSHDAFVTWLDSAGSSLLFSTYLGGGSEDSGFGIAVDGIGNIHVVGHTRSPDLPTTPGAYDTTCGTDGTCNGGLMDAFIAKIAFVPIVSLSPTSHDFGSLVVGATSGSLTVTLDNTGDAPLDIFTIEATGDFAVNDHTCPISPAQLLAGENCTIWVNFAPTALGNRTGTLSITDSAAGSPHTVELAGYGLPAMQFSATTLDFGNQVVGTSSGPRLVTLTNNDIELSFFIYSISATGDFAQTNNCPIYPAGALVGGESCNISVTFTPTATGAATGAITVTTDAPLSPHVVDLTGNGIASSGPTTCFPIIGQLQENYGRTPILFAANQGQTDPRVQFFARGRGYTLFLTGEEAVLALQSANQKANGKRQKANGESRQWSEASGQLPETTDHGQRTKDEGLRTQPLGSQSPIGNRSRRAGTIPQPPVLSA